jgi:hypothetical protein
MQQLMLMNISFLQASKRARKTVGFFDIHPKAFSEEVGLI